MSRTCHTHCRAENFENFITKVIMFSMSSAWFSVFKYVLEYERGNHDKDDIERDR